MCEERFCSLKGANLFAHARNGLCLLFCVALSFRKRGIGDDLVERVVLSVLVVDEPKIAVPHYYSRAAPAFCTEHADHIYTTTVVDPRGAAVRNSNAKMLELFGDGANVIPRRVEEIVGKASWLVTYDDPACTVLFRLRSRVTMHNMVGPWKISLQERRADFSGAVVVSSTFARFPSTGGAVVPAQVLGIPLPGRMFKYVKMARKSKLRRWLEDLFEP